MPVLAACSTCTPLPIESSKLLMSLARLLRPCAVKKLVGLSRAELTFLPVARRFCVVESRSAVDWRERRFWRTEAERTMPDIFIPFWCETEGKKPLQSFLIGRAADGGEQAAKEKQIPPTAFEANTEE